MRSPSLDRLRLVTLAVACLSLATGCGSDSGTAPAQDDATRAVTVFSQLADSVARSRGDTDVASAYASLAEAVRQGGRVSPIVITVDGVPTKYLATAQQTEFNLSFCHGEAKCLAAEQLRTLRSLIAWQQDDPRKLIQLSSSSDADMIFAHISSARVPYYGPTASLIYFDGKGGRYFGTSGSQKFGVTTSTTPCAASSPSRLSVSPPKCTQAQFSIAFSGMAEPSSFLSKSAATGSHTFAMLAQPVLGSRLELGALMLPVPPIKIHPSVTLPATLAATVDTVVTLTLTVSNPSSTPTQLTFVTGQEFDFTISDGTTGAQIWRWSAGMRFSQATRTKTIPANGSLVYSATWKPTRRGSVIATGSLVSVSHRAEVKMAVNIP